MIEKGPVEVQTRLQLQQQKRTAAGNAYFERWLGLNTAKDMLAREQGLTNYDPTQRITDSWITTLVRQRNKALRNGEEWSAPQAVQEALGTFLQERTAYQRDKRRLTRCNTEISGLLFKQKQQEIVSGEATATAGGIKGFLQRLKAPVNQAFERSLPVVTLAGVLLLSTVLLTGDSLPKYSPAAKETKPVPAVVQQELKPQPRENHVAAVYIGPDGHKYYGPNRFPKESLESMGLDPEHFGVQQLLQDPAVGIAAAEQMSAMNNSRPIVGDNQKVRGYGPLRLPKAQLEQLGLDPEHAGTKALLQDLEASLAVNAQIQTEQASRSSS